MNVGNLPNHVKYCVSVCLVSYGQLSEHHRSAYGEPDSQQRCLAFSGYKDREDERARGRRDTKKPGGRREKKHREQKEEKRKKGEKGRGSEERITHGKSGPNKRKEKRGRRSRTEPPGLPPRSPLYPPKTGARGGLDFLILPVPFSRAGFFC